MVVLGVASHPQALFDGLTQDDPAYLRMRAMVPSHQFLPADGVQVLRPVEWDIAVVAARARVPYIPGHMHLFATGCIDVGPAQWSDRNAGRVSFVSSQPSEVLQIPDDLPDHLRRLVMKDLVPYLQSQPRKPVMQISYNNGGVASLNQLAGDGRTIPFVLDADSQMLAGAFMRSDSAWCWAIPHVPDRPEVWFAAALQDWHVRTPTRVPRLIDWRTRRQWLTIEERESISRLEALQVERDHMTLDLDKREVDLEAELLNARQLADKGARALLTGQGDALVEVVKNVLETFGFEVVDVDETKLPGQAKTEDLQVSDREHAGWTNITEVKGYTGGAKISDFAKIGRYAELYARDHGSIVSSKWYVVNQLLNTDPDERQPPLQGALEDVEIFAEGGGLVIDTRSLFALLVALQEDRTTSIAIRQMLRSGTGILDISELVSE